MVACNPKAPVNDYIKCEVVRLLAQASQFNAVAILASVLSVFCLGHLMASVGRILGIYLVSFVLFDPNNYQKVFLYYS